MALFAPLALIGGWKYQGASGGIVYKITAAFRSDLSLLLKPVVISLSKESLDVVQVYKLHSGKEVRIRYSYSWPSNWLSDSSAEATEPTA